MTYFSYGVLSSLREVLYSLSVFLVYINDN